jgi:hypothetical protein
MMKKILLFFVAGATILSSCVKEAPVVDETPEVEKIVVTITATAPTHEDAKTRTQLVDGKKSCGAQAMLSRFVSRQYEIGLAIADQPDMDILQISHL